MAWNEPGGGNRDPWSGKGPEQGPPDLDEVVRKLQESLGGLFGGKRRGPGEPGGGPSGFGGNISGATVGIILAILFLVWIASGFYIIEAAERGVVLRFGAYNDRMTDPGLHWHIPYPVESVTPVNVDEIKSFTHQALMLTKDENIVDLELTVQYRIQDAADYLFQDQNPDKTLEDATETVVRKTIGGSRLDFILTEGRSEVAALIRDRTQGLVDQYNTGLKITSVNMQPAKPPDQVKEAFDDAIKAREDKERSENKAEAYANEILPQARGEAARVLAEAEAYRDKVVASAEGETSRFLALLEQYQQAPQVTRERLYLETMERVLGESGKVVLDVEGGANLIYLPLDRLLNKGGGEDETQARKDTATGISLGAVPAPEREVDRDRRSRR